VNNLVHAMNGELSCDSIPGNGATFSIRLPRPVL
jgi:signal transduction histidine kinase